MSWTFPHFFVVEKSAGGKRRGWRHGGGDGDCLRADKDQRDRATRSKRKTIKEVSIKYEIR